LARLFALRIAQEPATFAGTTSEPLPKVGDFFV
jgi:hypothetical protein